MARRKSGVRADRNIIAANFLENESKRLAKKRRASKEKAVANGKAK